ncbi:hypothetical protein ACWGCW_33800 [Streptomyces sp. NPDC054933]
MVIETHRRSREYYSFGEPFVHPVDGDQEAAREAATTEALAAWAVHHRMKRRFVEHAYQLTPDQWMIELDSGIRDASRAWLRVSVARAVKLPSDRPWQT